MREQTKKITLSAMFMALGLVLPFFTGQIPQIGKMLLPMHIPVFLCGLICGGYYGLIVGVILPVLRYMIFGMPIIYPTGIAMAFELATYGLVAGLMYQKSRWKCIIALFKAMVTAMLAGRIVWGIVQAILLGVAGNALTLKVFISSAFINAIPGIGLQLVLIPVVMVALGKTGLVEFHSKHKKKAMHKS